MREIIFRGGKNEERLFLQDLDFWYNDIEVRVSQTAVLSRSEMLDFIVRHKARYGLVGLFCKPTLQILDFTCGSGYASELLEMYGIFYEGKDLDSITIEYARRLYGHSSANFEVNDLTKPNLKNEYYNVIGCIEGLEHIEAKYQSALIKAFHKALISGGVLIISSPETESERSGLSSKNKYHLWELTKKDFVGLLVEHFPRENVELITQKNALHTGEIHNCFYGICHK